MRVLHVTEAMGGGVLTLMDTISRRQVENDAEVSVWFLPRPETPDDENLKTLFDERVAILRLSQAVSGVGRYFALIKAVRKAATAKNFDAIHLHSSKAGVAGRIATLFLRNRSSVVVYSPHGFAFLREDTSRIIRKATLLAEKIMARHCDALILTSKSEKMLAESEVQASSTYLLNTGISSERLRPADPPHDNEASRRLRVGMVGRVCYQKAPWRFSTVARVLHDSAEFVWIGGGADADVERWLNAPGINVTGWLAPEELAGEIDRLDVLLFPTLWEGMALSLMQAQAQGVPAVVSNVVGNVDSVVDGTTGFICATDNELVERTQQLLVDRDLRLNMARAAVEWAKSSLLDVRIGEDSMALYREISVKEQLTVLA